MNEIAVYDGMCAVCAVLEELEGRRAGDAALRLAGQHLRLLAWLVAAKDLQDLQAPDGASGKGGPYAELWRPLPQGGSHVRQ